MAQTLTAQDRLVARGSTGRTRFLIGGLLIIAAIVYLIISSTQSSAQYFLTVDEMKSKGSSLLGREIKVSGAVDGSTIQYDARTLTLTFAVANVPGDNKQIEAAGGLAAVLKQAVADPNATRMQVVYNGPRPDLLRNEAQAIMTGKLDENGVFHADELLLKCPTRYEESVPGQSQG
ncbi:MAG: cytochrome c maturation protein CcmE [Chloroflexi bacterium]|nr:cytochrome c maturation protein CcmE [Chloroflexota bacterium]